MVSSFILLPFCPPTKLHITAIAPYRFVLLSPTEAPQPFPQSTPLPRHAYICLDPGLLLLRHDASFQRSPRSNRPLLSPGYEHSAATWTMPPSTDRPAMLFSESLSPSTPCGPAAPPLTTRRPHLDPTVHSPVPLDPCPEHVRLLQTTHTVVQFACAAFDFLSRVKSTAPDRGKDSASSVTAAAHQVLRSLLLRHGLRAGVVPSLLPLQFSIYTVRSDTQQSQIPILFLVLKSVNAPVLALYPVVIIKFASTGI